MKKMVINYDQLLRFYRGSLGFLGQMVFREENGSVIVSRVGSQKEYAVTVNDGDFSCTCPDFQNGNLCMHAIATALYLIRNELNERGYLKRKNGQSEEQTQK